MSTSRRSLEGLKRSLSRNGRKSTTYLTKVIGVHDNNIVLKSIS